MSHFMEWSNPGLHGVTYWISFWDMLFGYIQTVRRVHRNVMLISDMLEKIVSHFCNFCQNNHIICVSCMRLRFMASVNFPMWPLVLNVLPFEIIQVLKSSVPRPFAMF